MNHIGIIISAKETEEDYQTFFSGIKNILNNQIRNDVPIITMYFPDSGEEFYREFDIFLKSNKDRFIKNLVKVSFFGDWYKLNPSLVREIKDINIKTDENDKFFLNFCIEYDGKQEILNAFKIIGSKVKDGELRIQDITKEKIKDNIYTSYFLPPEIIFKVGGKMKLSGFLLWDSADAEIKHIKDMSHVDDIFNTN